MDWLDLFFHQLKILCHFSRSHCRCGPRAFGQRMLLKALRQRPPKLGRGALA